MPTIKIRLTSKDYDDSSFFSIEGASLKKKIEKESFIYIRDIIVNFFNCYYKNVLKKNMHDVLGKKKAEEDFKWFLNILKDAGSHGLRVCLDISPELSLLVIFKKKYSSITYTITLDLFYSSKAGQMKGIHEYIIQKQYIKPALSEWKRLLKKQDKFDYSIISK